MKTHAGNAMMAGAALSLLMLAAASKLRAADRDYVEDADFPHQVLIAFNGATATVSGDSAAGVTVSTGSGSAAISITSTVRGVEYVLSGTGSDGYVQITSTYAAKVSLNGVSLTSSNGPAVATFSADRSFVVVKDGTSNSLADGAASSRTGTAALYGSGPLLISGKGSLSVTGKKSHGIASAAYVRELGGEVTIASAVKDGIHAASYFRMDDGSLSISASGDGIDADTGFVVINGGAITVRSTVDDTKGIKCDGTLTVNGGVLNLTVDGVQSKALSSGGDMSITGGALFVNMAGSVYLETVSGGTAGSYVDPSYSTGLKCSGNVTVSGGSIAITHTGTAGKGISAGGQVSIVGGTVDIATSGGTSASYTNGDGEKDIAASDCIKADGNVTVSGGTVMISASGAAGDGISSDQVLTVSGGSIDVTARGAQAKGLKSDGTMAILGGKLNFTMSGAVVLETVTTTTFNPSYCTAMKCGGNLQISAGSVTITHSGTAGKGISVDGNATITGGTLTLATSGANSSSFTNASNTLDMASADCLKVDGNLVITGGTLTATSTGTAGDAISCEGSAIIGTLGIADTPVISANTTGAHVLLSGTGMNADYVNAKAFSADGDVTMNGGIFRATTQQDGGEGMESKASLTIAGGTVEITAYDDCINAKTKITISGGSIYCYSSGNDGIDSNGTMLITGGTIVSSGTNSPEEGFDCDQNNFTITGGTMVGTGGATSTPTASTSTQRSVIYKGAGTLNVVLVVKSASGNTLVYKLPRTYSGGSGGGGSSSAAMTMLFSNANLASGTTYTILSGATISGGTEFHGLYTGATVTGGTTLKTFTPSSMVTTVQ